MARLTRLALSGQLHLVVQRGHNGLPVFVDDDDRRAYLAALEAAARGSGLAIHAYVLLDSAVHLLATPSTDAALSQAMQGVGRRYVATFNRRHGRAGALWEGRFRATVVEADGHFVDCLSYVEQAPSRQGLAANASDWPWSSAAHHLGRRRDPLISEHPGFWALGNTPFERGLVHRKRLEDPMPPVLAERIAAAEAKGWALGSPRFLLQLEQVTARPLSPRPRGRPRKPTSA